ncbi:PRI3-like protein [Schizophyllum commune H4-8]|nr:PRI3-like protein [Schizophyllum commune H4-8]KAI5886785.1 PRI3-like protein [Schizophyllum commune H4-8]
MKLTLSILALALAASSAVAIPFESRDIEIPDDRENCGLKDAQTAEAGSCNAQTAQHCFSGGGDCTYNPQTKRCSNGTLMRGKDAPVACLLCQCTAR